MAVTMSRECRHLVRPLALCRTPRTRRFTCPVQLPNSCFLLPREGRGGVFCALSRWGPVCYSRDDFGTLLMEVPGHGTGGRSCEPEGRGRQDHISAGAWRGHGEAGSARADDGP